jgi:hypothetical protein
VICGCGSNGRRKLPQALRESCCENLRSSSSSSDVAGAFAAPTPNSTSQRTQKHDELHYASSIDTCGGGEDDSIATPRLFCKGPTMSEILTQPGGAQLALRFPTWAPVVSGVMRTCNSRKHALMRLRRLECIHEDWITRRQENQHLVQLDLIRYNTAKQRLQSETRNTSPTTHTA